MNLRKAWVRFFSCALLIIGLLSTVLLIIFYNLSLRQETARIEYIEEFVRNQKLEIIENVVNNMVTEINMQNLAANERAERDLKGAVSILRLYNDHQYTDDMHAGELIAAINEFNADIDTLAFNLQTMHVFGNAGSEPRHIENRQQFESYFEDHAAACIFELGKQYLIGCGISKTAAYNTMLGALQIYADSKVPLGDVEIRIDALNNYSGQGDFAMRIITPFFQRSVVTGINAGNADYFDVFGKITLNGSAYSAYMVDGKLERLIYAKLYRPYDWVVSSSVSAKDIQQLTDSLAKEFKAQQNNAMVIISVMCLLFTGAALAAFVLLGRLFFHTADHEIKITESANQAKSNFLSTMSHEMRTPMNAIIGIAQIQLQKGDLPEEYATALETIHGSGNSLLGIINDILDMSKIETGKLELNLEEYDVPSLINDTVQLNIVRIGSKPIAFVLDIDENLPSRLYGDELRLKQILNNLLSNAIKYTEKGQVKLSVSYSAEGEDCSLHFIIEDTGQGMKLEDRDLFFSEYVRFNAATNRTTEGTGLGLAITKKLVEMMEGTIWVESEYGSGSVFMVMVKQGAVDCGVIGAELAKQLCSFTFRGQRQFAVLQIERERMPYGSVLVVDDVETNLYVANGLMTPYALKIDMVDSGFAAIDKVENGEIFDVIFMDHMMPKMDGVETTKRLRDSGYTYPIVALTANAVVGQAEMFIENGFDDFISKPIDVRQLNAVLNRFVRDRHPDEAKKHKPESAAAQIEPSKTNPALYRIFIRDVEKAIVALRETAGGELKSFTTTAHAMKAALAVMGENEASGLAAALEAAGLKGDTEYISANTEFFIETLASLVKRLKPGEAEGTDIVAEEDSFYLAEQLQIVKDACEDYDDAAAYEVLDRLQKKPWKQETAAMLDAIREALFLHSDFEGAAETIERLLEDKTAAKGIEKR